jgi:23S rRNA pseudoU1915 N3-methylase RlmH
MSKEKAMSKEVFNEIIDNLEYIETLTDYGKKGIKYNVKKIQEELRQEKENNKKLTKEYKERIADNLKYKDFVINCVHKNKIKEKLKEAIEGRDLCLETGQDAF